MRFWSFFALSLFLHVSLFALFNQTLFPPQEALEKEPSYVKLDIQTFHVEPSKPVAPSPPLQEPPVEKAPVTEPKPQKQRPIKTIPKEPSHTSSPLVHEPTPPPEPQEQPVVAPTQTPLHVTPKPDTVVDVFSVIQHAVAKHKRYPKRAQREGLEGEVVVHFSYSPQGVTHLKIQTPSGHALLDAYCLELIQNASPDFPQVSDVLDIVLPIGFYLKES